MKSCGLCAHICEKNSKHRARAPRSPQVLLAAFSSSRLWKPFVTILAGVLGVTVAVLYAFQTDAIQLALLNQHTPPKMTFVKYLMEDHAFGLGFYVTVGVGVFLVALGALQLDARFFGTRPADRI